MSRNIIANIFGRGWASIISLLCLPLYIAVLGLDAVGLIGIVGLFQAWFSILDMGMTPTLTREMARYTARSITIQEIHDLLRSLESVAFGVAFVIFSTIYLSSSFVARYWINSDLPTDVISTAITFISVVVSLRLVEGLYRGGLMGLQKQVLTNSLDASLATFRYGGALVVITLVSPTINAFFCWQAIASAVGIIVFAVSLNLNLPTAPKRARVSLQSIYNVFGFASGLIGVSLLSVFLTQLDKLLLSKILSLEQFGFYIVASSLAAAISLATSPIVQALYPRLVELAAKSDEVAFKNLFHRAAQLISIGAIPLGLTIAMYSKAVIYTWSGNLELATNCALLVSILTCGNTLHAIVQVPYFCQLAKGWTSLAVAINSIAAIILFPTLLIVVPRFGGTGAACTWLALAFGYVCVTAQFMHRKILVGEKWKWYVQDVITPTVGALLVLAISWGLKPASYDNRVVWLAFLVLTTCTAGIVSLVVASKVRPMAIFQLNVALNKARAFAFENCVTGKQPQE